MEKKYNKKRVALIGGMNNNFFSILRYLENHDYSCHLYLFANEHEHFLPENDVWNFSEYQGKIFTLPYRNSFTLKALWDSVANRRRINFTNYDLVLGCGYAPFLSMLFNFKLDLILPYGSDLTVATQYRKVYERLDIFQTVKNLLFNFGVYLQRKGFEACGRCWSLSETALYRELDILKKVSKIRKITPMVYHHSIARNPEIDREINKFLDLVSVEEADCVIASQARHLWSSSIQNLGEPALKQNDKLINAFAKVTCSKDANTKAKLVLFEYGPDIKDSKGLIRKLKIQDSVIWSKLMPRKYLLYFLEHFVSVGADQFAAGCFSGTSQEILASGTPVLLYLEDKQFQDGELKYDVFKPNSGAVNCSEVEAIAAELEKLIQNVEYRNRLGKNAEVLFRKHFGPGGATGLKLFLDEIYKKKNVKQSI